MSLSAQHFREIIGDSAVDPAVAEARGYRTLEGTGEDVSELEEAGFTAGQIGRDDFFPALLIPMRNMHGEITGHQVKPDVPRTLISGEGKTRSIKYETPRGKPIVLDVPAYTRATLRENEEASLWITEGVKKTDCLVSQGLAAIGLTGVYNWRNKQGTLGDWEDVPLKGRVVVLCFDADAQGNRNVQQAMARLGAWLRTRGAVQIKYIVVPASVGATETKGVDDFFAAGGTIEALAAAATEQAPGQGAADAAFTDAFLVEEAASEALDGRFCWASGLGWMAWSGKVWRDVSDVEPVEALRQWASDRFDRVLSEQRKDPSKNLSAQISGWRNVLSKARLGALVQLSRGIECVQRDARDFDADPDLLTVQNGTLHLPTSELRAFDPAHCITKMADAEYRPGYTHPDWTAALQALPDDLLPWYRDRLGQAATGYKTPDHVMPISFGSGQNGKSTITNTVRKTLGGYGVLISDRVLMASPDAHPTEMMDLRGARYAVLEETPEARHLNVQRLKQTLGTDTITARRIRQDPVEFSATHSMFINTNYAPVVTETDHGTWRRLALVTFPFTYRKRESDVTGPRDRLGDPRLEYAHHNPDVRSAALTWLAEGAREWYGRDRMMLDLPAQVEADTKTWRSQTDLVLGFIDECLTMERDAFTPVQSMLAAFNEWAAERGHRPWNDKTFATRFGGHDEISNARVEQKRKYVDGRQQRGWVGVAVAKPQEAVQFQPANPFDRK